MDKRTDDDRPGIRTSQRELFEVEVDALIEREFLWAQARLRAVWWRAELLSRACRLAGGSGSGDA